MTSPGAKGEKEEALADSTAAVPPEEKSGAGGGRSPPPPSSSSLSSSGTSQTGTSATSTAPLGYRTTDAGGTSPGEVSGQNTAQDTERTEAGGPAKTSGSTNEKRRSSSEEADARRTFSRTTSSSESPRRRNDEDVPDTTGDDTMQQPQEEKQDDDDERIRHEMDSNQHGEARLLPHKFKRRKVAAEAAAVNAKIQDTSTSTTTGASVPGESVTSTTRTTATSSTSKNAETSSSFSSTTATSGAEGILASSSQTEDDSAINTAHATRTATSPATTSLSAEIGILVAEAEQAAEANAEEAEAAHSLSSASAAAAKGIVGAASAYVASGRGQAQTQGQGQTQTQGQDLEARPLQLQPQHDEASSSSIAAVTAAQAAPAAPAPTVPPNSTADQYQQMQALAADQYQQMQALVAQKREQLTAALLAQQQLSVTSASAAAQASSLGRLGDLSGAASSIGLGLGALGTIGSDTSQASINAAAANLATARARVQAQVQAQAADAALSISSHPLVGNLSADSALRSYLMGTTTSPAGTGGRASGLLGTAPGQASANIPSYYDPISSSPNRTLSSQFGSPTHNPLSTGLDLTAMATNAMLQHQADLEYLQQLRAQRSLLSSISATSAAGLSPNDTATSILARLQAGTPGAGVGTVSASSSSVGFPSAASVASPSLAAAQSQGQVLGHSAAQIQGGTQGPSIISRGDEPRLSKAPPLPNITPTAAKAPADQRITRCDGVVCLSSGLPHFTNRTIVTLSAPDDVHWLSNYLCFVREKCVEVFEADDAELAWRSNANVINPRQVGIRCRYCAHIHQRDRAGRSTSFPSSLSRIYQSLTMMLREHFPTCTEMPPAIKERFLALKGQKTSGADQDKRKLRGSDISAKESRSYWVDSAKDIGLYDTELGIKRRTPPARAVQDSTFPSSGQGP